MNILNLEHISKTFGEKKIFDDISYGIHEGDKIGIIGINGTGKTTLLRVIAGQEEPDEGQVICQNGLRITFLSQNPEFPEGAAALSYVADGKEVHEAKSILNRLGITEHDKEIRLLSGGQKKRVALARALVSPADVLILDEPTNHLDDGMITWLEEYLCKWKGVLIMVTHDRYFLDRVTNKILEINHAKLYAYETNYTGFLELKAQREEMELASERKRQSILRMELEWAKRGCRARTTKQKARLERLELLKAGKAPIADQTAEIDSVGSRMGKKTIELYHISKAYDGQTLINDFTYIFLKNQRVGIIGPNGCGKSTLMNLITGNVEPDSGSTEIGETIRMGYYAQEVPDMDSNQRAIDYIRDVADYIETRDGKISASQLLERFLFDSNLQYTPVNKLSGGEKRRLYLCKVLADAPNVLLLDEPTNDLDVATLTILEDYLENFAGIVICVSHDRYFLDHLVDRIFAFEEGGTLRQYEGGYTEYLAARTPVTNGKAEEKKSSGKDWKQNQPKKLKFTYQEQKEYDTIDDVIAELEERIAGLEDEMLANATNSAKLSELTEMKAQAEALLEEKMDRWVYLNDLAEKVLTKES